jgi:hypothetical protein
MKYGLIHVAFPTDSPNVNLIMLTYIFMDWTEATLWLACCRHTTPSFNIHSHLLPLIQ